jgi:hypothetical protein
MKKILKIGITAILICIIAFVYYYIALPAVNIHSPGFWFFILGALIVLSITIGLATANLDNNGHPKAGKFFKNNLFKFFCSITVIMILILIIGSVLSSTFINSEKYQKLINITDRNFSEDIQEISYSEIPILDKDSAILLGSRKMGSMIEYVSQFEVGTNYTQINYQGVPVRVSPLQNGSKIKWFTNRSKGIPAYMQIDMTTQEVELIK